MKYIINDKVKSTEKTHFAARFKGIWKLQIEPLSD